MQPKRVALLTVLGSALLAALTLWAGIFSGSRGLVSDGIHAGGDILASLIVFAGVRREDEAARAKAAGALGFLMLLSAAVLSYTAVRSLLVGSTPCSLVAAEAEAAALAARTVLWRITARRGKSCRNAALCANARHLFTDVLASAAVLVGAACSRLGYPFVDSIASAGVAVAIFRVGFGLIRSSFGIAGKNSGKKTKITS